MKWLHRIGYVTTLVLAVQIVAICTLLLFDWHETTDRNNRQVERTKTHSGPLLNDPKNTIRKISLEMLGDLPPLEMMSGNGVRFAIMPSFGKYHYAIALWTPSSRGDPRAVVVVSDYSDGAQVAVFNPSINAEKTIKFLEYFDSQVENWSESASPSCLDGTTIEFERISKKKMFSGSGNCQDHYREIKANLFELIESEIPKGLRPTDEDWHLLDINEPLDIR